jgi:hypothetical protein
MDEFVTGLVSGVLLILLVGFLGYAAIGFRNDVLAQIKNTCQPTNVVYRVR